MAPDPPSARQLLGGRLRDLRSSWDGLNVTQRQVGEALNASPALISSWESGQAVPPEDRLKDYARLFSSRRSVDGNHARLLPVDDLTGEEDRERADLVDELVRLREEALDRAPTIRQTGRLGGRFWYFPDGQPITILCTGLSDRQLGLDERPPEQLPPALQYTANPTHPNAVYGFRNGDIDALLELVGHVRAENPTAEVRWRIGGHDVRSDLLTGHVVILGGGDARPGALASTFRDSIGLPVSFDVVPDDEEFGFAYVVTTDDNRVPVVGGTARETYQPRFVGLPGASGRRERVVQHGAPQLEYDVALIARVRNPLKQSARVVLCSGTFSRGTYGAVRTFTDANLRSANEEALADTLRTTDADPNSFWMLVKVPVFGGELTITPDLSNPDHRLRAPA